MTHDPVDPHGQGSLEPKVCVLCGQEYDGWGNNPEPVAPYEDGQCCDVCNTNVVVPARIGRLGMGLPMRDTEEDPT